MAGVGLTVPQQQNTTATGDRTVTFSVAKGMCGLIWYGPEGDISYSARLTNENRAGAQDMPTELNNLWTNVMSGNRTTGGRNQGRYGTKHGATKKHATPAQKAALARAREAKEAKAGKKTGAAKKSGKGIAKGAGA